MEEAYTPISCSFYDRLEEAATLKKVVNLQYFEGDLPMQKQALIKTIKIRDKIEWLFLVDGTEVRLDRIHSIDGVKLSNHC